MKKIIFILAMLLGLGSVPALAINNCASCYSDVDNSNTVTLEALAGWEDVPETTQWFYSSDPANLTVTDEGEFATEFLQVQEPLPEMPTEKPKDFMGWIAFGSLILISLISVFAPSTIQGMGWYNMLMKVLNFLAFNGGKAKNADDLPLHLANRPPPPLTVEEANQIDQATNPFK